MEIKTKHSAAVILNDKTCQVFRIKQRGQLEFYGPDLESRVRHLAGGL